MKLNLRIASLLIVIGIFGFSSIVLAQKTTANKAQPKAGTNSANPKKAKNINTGEVQTPNTGNTRPASTGTGNASNRPASTSGTFTEIQKVVRQLRIFRSGVTIPQHITEDSGSNLARIKSYIDQAENKSEAFYNAVQNSNPNSSEWYFTYDPLKPENMNDLKGNLQKVLSDLNSVQFEVGESHRLSTIDFTTRAINQIDAYLINPPRPSKKAPNGAKTAKPKTSSQLGNEKQPVNTNTIDTSLKTAPAGSTPPAKPAKTTNKKPNANGTTNTTSGLKGELTTKTPKKSGKTIKPTENLDPLDDPWGKTPKKKIKN